MTELGLILSNASACHDPAVARELLDVAESVDADPLWDCIWVGDSLLSVPRLESLTLLGACAARTERIRLGVPRGEVVPSEGDEDLERGLPSEGTVGAVVIVEVAEPTDTPRGAPALSARAWRRPTPGAGCDGNVRPFHWSGDGGPVSS